jgi:hypothetical protein
LVSHQSNGKNFDNLEISSNKIAAVELAIGAVKMHLVYSILEAGEKELYKV